MSWKQENMTMIIMTNIGDDAQTLAYYALNLFNSMSMPHNLSSEPELNYFKK